MIKLRNFFIIILCYILFFENFSAGVFAREEFIPDIYRVEAGPAKAEPVPYKEKIENLKDEDTLSLEDCIKIALENHPELKSAVALKTASHARVTQAYSNYYPQISYSANYDRNEGRQPYDPVYNPIVGGTSSGSDSYFTGFSLRQNIYDFGRTHHQVIIARENLKASQYDLFVDLDRVIFEIRQAYFQAIAAERALEISIQALEQRELQLKYARNFYEIGRRAKIEVTKAEVDVANAQLEVIKARNNINLARINLAKTMGIDDYIEESLETDTRMTEKEMSMDTALDLANKFRPELLKFKSQVSAQKASVDLARAQYYPRITSSASYGFNHQTSQFRNRSWGWGVQLSFDVLTSGYRSANVREKKYLLVSYKERQERLWQDISSEVKSVYLNLTEARARIAVLEKALVTARENFELARGRYEAGLSTNLEYSDAQLALQQAENDLVSAVLDYQIAQSQLERTTGVTVISDNLQDELESLKN
ncbi:MAG: TolC family protein [Vulcanimicrobiota bacterium]